MAFNSKEFEKATYRANGKIIEVPNLYQSIKSDKYKGKQFVARFKLDGKIHTKYLGNSTENKLTPKTAQILLQEYKTTIENGFKIDSNISLNAYFDNHFVKTLNDSRWTIEQIGSYNRYVRDTIGKKRVVEIVSTDIKKVLSLMEKNQLKPNTRKKTLQVLRSVFNQLEDDKAIQSNPITKAIKIKSNATQKIVTNATDTFKRIVEAITTIYKDNPFYQALFLFLAYGRRKSEVLNLRWENVDFTNNYYWLQDTKPNENQMYPLPHQIKQQLLLIQDTKKGLVFKSPVTGDRLVDIKRQVAQLKKYLNMPNFHLHYMRHILVSMLAEQNTEGVVMSGILGHKDLNTLKTYLTLNYFKSGQIGIKKIDEVIDIEVVE